MSIKREIELMIERYFAKKNSRNHTKISMLEKLYYSIIKSYPSCSCRFCGLCTRDEDGELIECSIGICERQKWIIKQSQKINWGE